MNTPKRGFEFTHDRMLDVNWHPSPGQHLADGPKVRMVVTRTTHDRVWYTIAGSTTASWVLDRAEFTRRFCS